MPLFKKTNKDKKAEEANTKFSTTQSVSLTNSTNRQNSTQFRTTESIKNETVNTRTNKTRSFSMYSSTETSQTLNNSLTSNNRSFSSLSKATGGIISRPIVPYRSAFISEPLTVQRDATPIRSKPSPSNIPSLFPRTSTVYKSLPTTTKPKPATISPNLSNTHVNPLTTSTNNQNNTRKIEVKKTGKRYDENCSIPVYKTSSKKRGEALIINNIMFQDRKDYRFGAEKDGKHIQELFKQLGFTVNHKSNLKAKQIKNEVESFSKRSSLKSVDISVVVVMSHGTNRETLGTYTEIFGTDDKGVNVENIINNFTSQNCPHMINKPKIFIFQCCRGNNENFTQTDATLIKPNLFADVLIAHSTLPGFVSNRNPETGTWYIQTICDVFSEHAHEHHVEDMLKIVDDKLSKFSSGINQTSSYESRGFKRCYFHPV